MLWSVKNGQLSFVKLLHEKGCDVKNVNLLINAICSNENKTVEYLLENGSDFHANNEEALKIAVKNGRFEAATLLLSRGANLYIDNEECVILAIEHRKPEILKLLVFYGAECNSTAIEKWLKCVRPYTDSYPSEYAEFIKLFETIVECNSKNYKKIIIPSTTYVPNSIKKYILSKGVIIEEPKKTCNIM